MRDLPSPTAETSSRDRLLRASAGLLALLVLAGLAVVGLYSLPLGRALKPVSIGWLLVVLASYWLYAGLGYRPLLLLQLFAFSAAASIGSVHLLVGLRPLRFTALGLAAVGGVLALINLVGMLRDARRRPPGARAA